MPIEYKNALWEMAKDKFNLSDDQYGWVLNSLNLKWKENKCDLKRKLFKVYDNDAKMIANKDPDVLHDQLAILIEHWRSENAQKRAKINEENRAKHKMPHTAGSKSFARIIDEQETVLGHEPSRAQIFIKTHTRKDGTPVNDISGATIEQLQEWMSQVPNASEDANVRNDIFSEVLGPEPRGRVRGLGLGASQSVWSRPSTRVSSSSNEDKAAIASLQTKVNELQGQLSKVNELQGQLQWMMEMWQREHPGSHPPGSHPPDLSQ